MEPAGDGERRLGGVTPQDCGHLRVGPFATTDSRDAAGHEGACDAPQPAEAPRLTTLAANASAISLRASKLLAARLV
jgi:hypothetical protein